jgi:hypothetical protein
MSSRFVYEGCGLITKALSAAQYDGFIMLDVTIESYHLLT